MSWAFGATSPRYVFFLEAGVACLMALWGLRMLLERRPTHGSFAFRGLDGRERDITVTAFPLLSRPDEVVGVMSIFWEVPAAP